MAPLFMSNWGNSEEGTYRRWSGDEYEVTVQESRTADKLLEAGS